MILLYVSRIGIARAKTRPVRRDRCLAGNHIIRTISRYRYLQHYMRIFRMYIIIMRYEKNNAEVVTTTNGGSYGSCGMRGPLL